MSLLEIKNLRKSYGAELVLSDISMELPEHSVKVLIGASGSGKSTLLRCINLLEEIEDGQILLDGEDITAVTINPDKVRAQIGSVFQSFNLFPHLTVLENITLAPTLVHGIENRDAIVEARELLSRFGLLEKANQYPDLLSGGQQQRVAILRAIINRPKLLLLDEVTSALDPTLVGEVLDLLSDLAQQGTTMLIATHEMQFARDVAHRVALLDAGRLVEVAPAAQFFNAPSAPETVEFLSRVPKTQ
jgi:polar amino acid transport system ATP-binding protein